MQQQILTDIISNPYAHMRKPKFLKILWSLSGPKSPFLDLFSPSLPSIPRPNNAAYFWGVIELAGSKMGASLLLQENSNALNATIPAKQIPLIVNKSLRIKLSSINLWKNTTLMSYPTNSHKIAIHPKFSILSLLQLENLAQRAPIIQIIKANLNGDWPLLLVLGILGFPEHNSKPTLR